MRASLLFAAMLLMPLAAAQADEDTALMDLSQGPWRLSEGGAASCALTLGDRPVDKGRFLDGGGDCRALEEKMVDATGWRIDTPGTLSFLDDRGHTLLRMTFNREAGTFHTAPERIPELTLVPAE